jgi:D-3-phosphoglycerate dehydrogenase / 2-oxoglutarate reductase
VKIVSTGPVAPPAEEILGPIAVPAPGELEAELADADALIVRGGHRVTAELLAAAPRLKAIGRSGVGVDNVDLESATRRGIPVVITPGAGAQAVAEGALALMLALAKQLPALDDAVREGRWSARDELEIRDLAGATLGIVGLGRIGLRVAELAQPFGVRLIAHDPFLEEPPGIELVDLPVLFGESDLISVHAPLTPETEGLIDAGLLSLAGGAILVNLSRGGLVRSLDDLHAALESGALYAVGLDVFDPEPPDLSHPLFDHPRVLLSPHALGLSRGARRQIFEEVAEGVAAVLRGERPAAVANPEVYDLRL